MGERRGKRFIEIHGDFDQLKEHKKVHSMDRAEVAINLTARDMGWAADRTRGDAIAR